MALVSLGRLGLPYSKEMHLGWCLLLLHCLCVYSGAQSGDGTAATVKLNLSPQRPLSVLMTVSFFPGHLFVVMALGEELVKRGHNVTLVTTEMKGSRLLPELPESVGIHFVSAGYSSLNKQTYEQRMKQIGDLSMDLHTVYGYFDEITSPIIQIGKKVDEIGPEKFDMIIAEMSTFPLVPYFAQKTKVLVVSTLLPPFQATSPPWPAASVGTSETDNLTFYERLLEPFLVVMVRLLYWIMFKGVIGDDHFRNGVNQMDLHIPGIKVPLLISTVIGFEYPHTITPLTHYVGPVLMSHSPPLDPELQQWLDTKPDQSVVYISMGTSATLSPEAAMALIGGINVTSFYAVWSLRTSNQYILDGIELDKSRFYISDWVPQQSLLEHRSIRMAILHCGMNGVHEALYNGVPIITAPYAMDQFENAARICHAGVGVELTKHLNQNFSSQQVEEAIVAIDTRDCREKTQKMRRLFLEAGCTQTAADLVEYYEAVGWEHLVPAYAKYNWSWIQYYNVDVYIILATVTSVFLMCVYKLIMLCLQQ